METGKGNNVLWNKSLVSCKYSKKINNDSKDLCGFLSFQVRGSRAANPPCGSASGPRLHGGEEQDGRTRHSPPSRFFGVSCCELRYDQSPRAVKDFLLFLQIILFILLATQQN